MEIAIFNKCFYCNGLHSNPTDLTASINISISTEINTLKFSNWMLDWQNWKILFKGLKLWFWFMTSCFILKLRNIPKFRSYSLLVGWYASKCHLLFIWYFFLTFVISNFQILKNFAFLSFFSCQMWSRNWLKMLFRSDFDQISTFFLGRLVPNFNRSPISIQD